MVVVKHNNMVNFKKMGLVFNRFKNLDAIDIIINLETISINIIIIIRPKTSFIIDTPLIIVIINHIINFDYLSIIIIKFIEVVFTNY